LGRTIEERAEEIRASLLADARLGKHVSRQPIPKVHRGSEGVWLIILGQDPTTRKPSSGVPVTTVLDLDHHGSLRLYLTQICGGLGIDLNQHVYATNYLKNFFVKPPNEIREIDVFEEFFSRWLPLLQEELAEFPGVPVITLGESLLKALVRGDASPCVRDYWGYTPRWNSGERSPFRFLKPSENRLGRVIFPFPHQPSIRKQFYRETFGDYVAFARGNSGLTECSYPVRR
jgi:uracil-DNA glycosylase